MDADTIIARLREKSRRPRREFTESYHPSAVEILGVSAPEMRAVLREVRKATKQQSPNEIRALALDIVGKNTHEGRQLAYELIAGHRGALELLRLKDVEALGRGIDNWASVDGFATTISGPAWRMGNISDSALKRWAKSIDRWWRRAALVSTVPLNVRSRGGEGDVTRTLMICEMLVDDHDDMVAKGTSWALRELAVRAPKEADAFVTMHESQLARRVVREVRNKLATGLKNPKPARA